MSITNEPPKQNTGDYLHAGVRGALSAIPIAGGMAVEVFNAIVTPPIERRRDEWRKAVGTQLSELMNAGFLKAEDLSSNESFVSTLLQATTVAIRNHQEEKLEALRNAVANSALPHPPDESMQQLFLQLVDQFTVWHLRLLKLFQDPVAWFKETGKKPPSFAISSNLEDLMLAAFPELRNQQFLYDRVAADLQSQGLYSGNLRTMMSESGAFQKRTSDLGNRFLKFVEKPSV